MNATNVWALVLAGGDGNRLRALTTAPCGTHVPKQYCSLCGDRTLIEDAVDRARGLVTNQHICAVVAEHHRHWWSQTAGLAALPPRNIFVQPRNRGTAIGIVYSLLHLHAKDPHARVVLLPADHYVQDESLLREAMMIALAHLAADDRHPVLLGMEPDESDTELGYIVPGTGDRFGTRDVCRFVEKPTFAFASDLIGEGALWNTFIIAATVRSLIDLFMRRYAPIALEMQVVVSRALSAEAPTGGWPMIVDMYQRLPELDFSRDVLQGQESQLCVVAVPPCGWSDLGTPRRIADTLRRTPQSPLDFANQLSEGVRVSLAAAHARFERAARDPNH
jgi:mannose-1-phosphate guanylyltransferase